MRQKTGPKNARWRNVFRKVEKDAVRVLALDWVLGTTGYGTIGISDRPIGARRGKPKKPTEFPMSCTKGKSRTVFCVPRL